jgi:hypothetical protein
MSSAQGTNRNVGRGDSGGDVGGGRKHEAGAFDIRNIIGALVGVYGVILVIMGLVANSADDQRRTGDVNANLWAGIVMLVVGIVFIAWSRLRPVVVDPKEISDDDRPPGH